MRKVLVVMAELKYSDIFVGGSVAGCFIQSSVWSLLDFITSSLELKPNTITDDEDKHKS